MALTLRIVTPTRTLVDAEVSELTAPGVVGEFGVLPEHVTFLGQLDLGVLTYVEGGTSRHVVVLGGYAEVVDDVVTVLADEAEFPDDIDAEVARADVEEARAKLDAGHEDPYVVEELIRAHRRAEVRFSVGS